MRRTKTKRRTKNSRLFGLIIFYDQVPNSAFEKKIIQTFSEFGDQSFYKLGRILYLIENF